MIYMIIIWLSASDTCKFSIHSKFRLFHIVQFQLKFSRYAYSIDLAKRKKICLSLRSEEKSLLSQQTGKIKPLTREYFVAHFSGKFSLYGFNVCEHTAECHVLLAQLKKVINVEAHASLPKSSS